MSRSLLPVLALLCGCIRQTGPGPDLGPCADYPDGAYAYGEVGIGSCLAGPVDLQFLDIDGRTWLAVANSDPFLNFASGSVLLIDWATVNPEVGNNSLADLTTSAFPTDRFVGGLGYLPDRQLLLVSGRLSEEAATRSSRDRVHVLDLSDPEAMSLWSEGDTITVEDDPMAIAVHQDAGRAYVYNLTDHSISVLDTTATPIAPVERPEHAEASDGIVNDADNSGSVGELVEPTLGDTDKVDNDVWTLTWVDGSYRVWLPDEGGFTRFTTGLAGPYVESGLGVELDGAAFGFDAIDDPYHVLVNGKSNLYFAGEGSIFGAVADTSIIGSWAYYDVPFVVGGAEGEWDHHLGAPSLIAPSGTFTFFYDARTNPGADASIGSASSEDGENYTKLDEPVVVAPEGFVSAEDPFVIEDAHYRGLRMWMSLLAEDGSWSIGLSEGQSASTLSSPEVVLSIPGHSVAAPTVVPADGRYVMWFAYEDGNTWTIATSWSWDGRAWTDPVPALEARDNASALGRSPRVAVQADLTSGYRVEGLNTGKLNGTVTPGTLFISTATGMALRVAQGHDVPRDVVGDQGAEGMDPGAWLRVAGQERLYVTTHGTDGRNRIAALSKAVGGWTVAGADLVPTDDLGGGTIEVSDPVAFDGDDGAVFIVTAVDGEGGSRLMRLTTTDGLTFTVDDEILETEGNSDAVGRRAHSVQELDGGTLRLWYSASDGTRSRIFSAISDDGGKTFSREPGREFDWQLDTGAAGTFDDTAISEPVVYFDGEVEHLWYAGFDGAAYSIGHATRAPGEDFEREVDADGSAGPALGRQFRTFAAAGTRSPVLRDTGTGLELWYAGLDANPDVSGGISRIGRAVGAPGPLYPAMRFNTPNDTIVFETTAKALGSSVIPLDQSFDGFNAVGWGGTFLRYDDERGFLYAGSKLFDYFFVLDARDDGVEGDTDANFLDVEAVLTFDSITGSAGFRDFLTVPGQDIAYATGRRPDALLAVDLSLVVDDDSKQVIPDSVAAALPLMRSNEDAGVQSLSPIGGAGMALGSNGEIFVTHEADNALDVFDRNLGPYGQEIRRLEYLGENPHVVRVSPDGRFAVIANYLGQVDGEEVNSTLAVVDVDPASPTYLQVRTWISNR